MSEHAPLGRPCRCNLPGWMPGIEHVPPVWQDMIEGITGVAPGQMKPIVGVDHVMQGWQTTMIAYARQQDPERRVVVHFTIGRDGRQVQHLSLFDPGRHVGVVRRATWSRAPSSAPRGADPWSIGWEHEGFSAPLRGGEPAFVRDATWRPGNPWPEAMVEASLETKVWAWRHAPSLATLGPPGPDTLVGHYHLDGVNRVNDPVAADYRHIWPRERFVEGLLAALLPPLTAEQRQLLEWLESPEGRALPEAQRRQLMRQYGVDGRSAAPAPGAEQPAPGSDADIDAAAAAVEQAREALLQHRRARTAVEKVRWFDAAVRAVEAARSALGRAA